MVASIKTTTKLIASNKKKKISRPNETAPSSTGEFKYSTNTSQTWMMLTISKVRVEERRKKTKKENRGKMMKH